MVAKNFLKIFDNYLIILELLEVLKEKTKFNFEKK